MRLLGGLALVAPIVLISLLVAMPSVVDSLGDGGVREAVAAIAAGAVGVSLTAILVAAYSRLRLRQIIITAERLADGELGATVQIGRAHV